MSDIIKLGLLEDEELHFSNWKNQIMASRYKVELFDFDHPDKLFTNCETVRDLDLLVLDRMIVTKTNTIDVFSQGIFEKILEIYKGFLVLNSSSSVPDQYKKHFNYIIKNKILGDFDHFIKATHFS